MMELWPFTNFHDLNLDWIIKRIKNVEDAEANAKASEEAAKASEEAAKASEEAAKASEEAAANSANEARYYKQDMVIQYEPDMEKMGDLPLPANHYPQGMAWYMNYIYYICTPLPDAGDTNIYLYKVDASLTLVDSLSFTSTDPGYSWGNSVTIDHNNDKLFYTGGGNYPLVIIDLNTFTVDKSVPTGTTQAERFGVFAIDDINPDLFAATPLYSRNVFVGQITNNSLVVAGKYNDYLSGGALLQDATVHNNKLYQAYWCNGDWNEPKYSIIDVSYYTTGNYYLQVKLDKEEEIQGLTRNINTGEYYVSFADGEIYNIGILPTQSLYTAVDPEQSHVLPCYHVNTSLTNYDTAALTSAGSYGKTWNLMISADFPVFYRWMLRNSILQGQTGYNNVNFATAQGGNEWVATSTDIHGVIYRCQYTLNASAKKVYLSQIRAHDVVNNVRITTGTLTPLVDRNAAITSLQSALDSLNPQDNANFTLRGNIVLPSSWGITI